MKCWWTRLHLGPAELLRQGLCSQPSLEDILFAGSPGPGAATATIWTSGHGPGVWVCTGHLGMDVVSAWNGQLAGCLHALGAGLCPFWQDTLPKSAWLGSGTLQVSVLGATPSPWLFFPYSMHWSVLTHLPGPPQDSAC